jgi:hypothetical protein
MIQSDPIWFLIVISMMAAPFLAVPVVWVLDRLGIGGKR